MDTVRRYSMLIDGVASVAKGGREHTVHVDLSGLLDRRAYPLLLGTPPA